MTFTALHRALGVAPGPLTDDLLDDAVAVGVAETNDLDWKSELPPTKDVSKTDFPKDIAAMANSGGGILVYGVSEEQKAATGRVDVGALTEIHERTLRSAAISAISPPVFGLTVHRLGEVGNQAVVIEIPASVDGPHLIYRGEYFGAPARNDSDTVWMKEREVESMYRARFDERRHATEALDTLYAEATAGRDIAVRAWIVAVAHPRIPRIGNKLNRDQVAYLLSHEAPELTLRYSQREGIHPLENVDQLNPRPGLRRWVAAPNRMPWVDAWISVHHDGSVSLAAAIGAHRRSSDASFEGWQIASEAVECAVSDFMAVIRAAAEVAETGEYEARVGIEWAGAETLTMFTRDQFGYAHDGGTLPLHRFSPVESTIDATASNDGYHQQVHDLALDCVNQGGVSNLTKIRTLPS